jgi:SAM-dependent methyltransferase
MDAVDWLLEGHLNRVVDLGAGTGAMTRLLVGRVAEVIAVEPDERMRAVLAERVPDARAVDGRGESMPIEAGSVGAVLASSSWHWMDVVPTLHEVDRILVPGGVLGAVWSGPDPEGSFIVQAQALLSEQSSGAAREPGSGLGGLADVMLGDAARPPSTLEIPDGVPFSQPDHEAFRWNVALNADELIGLLGTLSWIITMDGAARERVFAEARQLLRELLGIEGGVTVDVAFRADAWRSHKHS